MNQSKLSAIIEEIEGTLSSMPLEFSDIKFADGSEVRKTTAELTEEIDLNLRLLHAMAKLGDQEALLSIRDIGVSAAKFLEELACPADEQQMKSDRFPPQHREPAIFLQCATDMLPILEIIKREQNFISSLCPVQIRKAFDNHVDYVFDLYFSCEQLLLYFPDMPYTHSSPKCSNQDDIPDSTASIPLGCSDALEMLRNRTPEEKQGAVCISTFCNMVNGIARTIYLRKSRTLVQRSARSLAALSLYWPVVAHAWQESLDILSNQVQDLELGSALPFKVKRNTSKGRPRDFDDRSSTLFGLSLISRLSEQQLMFPSILADETKQLAAIDKWLDDLSNTQPDSRECRTTTINGNPYTWNLQTHWRLKAVLLPEFPKSVDTGLEAESRWKDAMLSLANDMCQGDWEGYPWWPLGVHERGRYDKKAKRHRTKYQAVAELINKGMQNLVKDAPSRSQHSK